MVLDPVMVATSGDRLLSPDAIDILKRELIPRALIITPNLPEAAALLETPIADTEDEMRRRRDRLLELGARAVLIKGGHGGGPEARRSAGRARRGRRASRPSASPRKTPTAPAARCRRPSRPVSPKACASPKPWPRPSPTSPHAIDAADELRSATATGRCIIFMPGGRSASMTSSHAATSSPPQRRGRRSPRPPSPAPKPTAGAWSRHGRSACPGPACRPSASPSASRCSPAAGCKSPCHAAGEIVPAFEVLDAVGGGVAEIGHTAAFYWQGKKPAAKYFTTVPFGLTPNEHVAWVEAGGGQALWDELYKPFGVKPFMGGNTGVCMGGWFRREIKSLDDMRGLKIRSLGLGGEVYRRLGATPQTTPPGEILTSACNPACWTRPNSSAPAPTSRSGFIAWRRSITAPASTSRTAPANASCR